MLITLAIPAALCFQIAAAHPSRAPEPHLRDVLEHLAASYALTHSYQVRCEVFEASSLKDNRPIDGAAPLMHKLAKVSSDGRVLIDDTHPDQARALGLQRGTIYRAGTVVSIRTGKEAIRQDVGETLAMAMPARYAPSHLAHLVSYWANLDPQANIVEHAPDLLEVACPTHHMSFSVRPSDWTVVSWSEGGNEFDTRNFVEEFQTTSAFHAKFPRRIRATSTRRGTAEPLLVTVTLFSEPRKAELSSTETEWWSYSPSATDLAHKSFFGPHDVPITPPAIEPSTSRPRPGVDAMLITQDPGGSRLPVEDRQLRNWLLGAGITFIILGIAWTIRKRTA